MHLVIPYASALSDAAVQALGTLSLPNLERLLARWAPVEDATTADLPDADEYALSLPHERLLARLRGWPVRDGLLPFAAEAARRDGFAPETGSGWGLLTPAHWHVGRDQVNLVDPGLLELDEPEARTLHDTLAPLFTELGWTWHWATPTRWYVSHPSLAELPTASIDRVIGRNVDLWLNDHPGVMLVRRLQSEVQMLLYVHPLNDAREARGAMSVNSFWLAGTGPAQPADKALPADVVVDDRLRHRVVGRMHPARHRDEVDRSAFGVESEHLVVFGRSRRQPGRRIPAERRDAARGPGPAAPDRGLGLRPEVSKGIERHRRV